MKETWEAEKKIHDAKIVDEALLAGLISEFGRAAAISALANTLSNSEAINAFSKAECLKPARREIKVIATYYDGMSGGGTERVLAQLISVWTEMGYRVILFTDEPKNENDYSYPRENARRVILRGSMADIFRIMESVLLEEKVDIFVNHKCNSYWLLWQTIFVKSLGIPHVLYSHMYFAYPYIWHRSDAAEFHKIYAMSDLVLALSEVSVRFYRLCGCNAMLVHNPVPANLLGVKPNECRPAGKNVLWLSRIDFGKNLDDTIRIINLVRDRIPDVKLNVVGTGDSREIKRCKKLCRSLGLADNVIFHGFQRDVEPFYRSADVMLMTSDNEGYPTVLVESKAYGVPTVMYELPYLESVKDGKGIVAVPVGDIESAANQIDSVLSDEELCYRLATDAADSFHKMAAYDVGTDWKMILNLASAEEYDGEEADAPFEDSFIVLELLKRMDFGKSESVPFLRKAFHYALSIIKRIIKH